MAWTNAQWDSFQKEVTHEWWNTDDKRVGENTMSYYNNIKEWFIYQGKSEGQAQLLTDELLRRSGLLDFKKTRPAENSYAIYRCPRELQIMTIFKEGEEWFLKVVLYQYHAIKEYNIGMDEIDKITIDPREKDVRIHILHDGYDGRSEMLTLHYHKSNSDWDAAERFWEEASNVLYHGGWMSKK